MQYPNMILHPSVSQMTSKIRNKNKITTVPKFTQEQTYKQRPTSCVNFGTLFKHLCGRKIYNS